MPQVFWTYIYNTTLYVEWVQYNPRHNLYSWLTYYCFAFFKYILTISALKSDTPLTTLHTKIFQVSAKSSNVMIVYADIEKNTTKLVLKDTIKIRNSNYFGATLDGLNITIQVSVFKLLLHLC